MSISRDTMVGIQTSRIPLSRKEIKSAPQTDSWRSPGYGDGGWHNNVNENIDWHAMIPLKDRAVVELFHEYRSEIICITDPEETQRRFARVISVGTGTRVMVNGEERRCCCLKPGDVVMIGQHDDIVSQDGNYAIIQEEDVRLIGRDPKASTAEMVRRMKDFIRGQNGKANRKCA